MSVARALLTSARDEWFTPQHILDRVAALDPKGRIALDPCWHPSCLVKAETTFALAEGEDGLACANIWQEWAPRNRVVFVNPPYSQIAPWMTACSEHHGTLVALVPARTDTRWFHASALQADSACFIKGRLKFANTSARYSAPFPSVLLYWGRNPDAFRDKCWPLGWVVEPERFPF